MAKKNFRIKDIARVAGVSVGTVDRVLHNRGKVSGEALKKVEAVLQKNEYKPNLIARSLGASKNYKIIALIPEPSHDAYWALVDKGIKQSKEEWMHYGVEVECCYFNLSDKDSFESTAAKSLKKKPDAILLAPVLYKESMPFLETLENKQTPFALFNTNIMEVDALSFIGQDLHKSGRLAGELICFGQKGAGIFGVLHVDEDLNDSVHLLEKEKGFIEYVSENYKWGSEIESLNRKSSSDFSFKKKLATLLNKPNLKGIFVTTSHGLEIVAAFLKSHGKNEVRLIGYDLLEKNIAYLREGVIDFLIHQKPQQQAIEGIKCLVNHLIFKRESKRVNLFPLSVITSQNVESFLIDIEHATVKNPSVN